MIKFDHVYKSYSTKIGANLVLNDINLIVNPGQRLGILGRNGSGKSTLVRLMSGATFPDKGKITRTMTVSWPLGLASGLQSNLTGYDNVRFISRVYGVDPSHSEKFIRDFTELGHYLNDKIFNQEVIPDEIFKISPSAELSAEQTVGVGGDPMIYEYHDFLFRAFVERWDKASPSDILRWYMEGTLEEIIGCPKGTVKKYFPTNKAFIDDLERWWKLFSGFAVAKRIQAPPIISLSRRAYGYDHREAQLIPYFSLEYQCLKTNLLNE